MTALTLEIEVVNPSAYERTGLIFTELPESRPHLRTRAGAWVPVQWLEHGPTLVGGAVVEPVVTVAAQVTVPASGRIVLVASAAPALSPGSGPGGGLPVPGVLDNGLLRVEATPDGTISLRAPDGGEIHGIGCGVPGPVEVDDVVRGTLVSAMEIIGGGPAARVELRAGEPFARLEAGLLEGGEGARLAVIRGSASRFAVMPCPRDKSVFARLAGEYRHDLLVVPGASGAAPHLSGI
ncbi:hypothetical protein [Acrocarpospora sp. B8E8]|uniref:hypothetical protein n=1 Tax=Acrocarpospora sp. B8E8 TaxID=3153572 RepID=UPI00325F5063